MLDQDTFYRDTPIGTFTANIRYLEESGYVIDFFSPQNDLIASEPHPGKTIHFLESYVQNKLHNIGVLKG